MNVLKVGVFIAAAAMVAGCNTTSQQSGVHQAEGPSPQETSAQQTGAAPAVGQAAPAVVQTTAAPPAAARATEPLLSAQQTMLLLEVTPHEALSRLNTSDRNYNSPGCREAREKAAAYVDTTGQRVAVSVGASVVLGLVGVPVAVVPSLTYEQRRRALINRDLVLHCASNAEQIFAALEARRQQQEREFMDRASQATP